MDFDNIMKNMTASELKQFQQMMAAEMSMGGADSGSFFGQQGMMGDGDMAESKPSSRIKLVVEDHPLHAAAKSGQLSEAARLLEENGSLLDQLDDHGKPIIIIIVTITLMTLTHLLQA